MIKFKKLLSFFCMIIFLFPLIISAETLDRVIAIVNDDVITQSEFNTEMKSMILQLRASGGDVSQTAELKKRLLKHLIEKKLQLQVAKQLNIKATDKEINEIVARIAAQNNMTASQLLERIQAEGISVSNYKNNLREQIILQKVRQKEVANKISLSPLDVEVLKNSPKYRKQVVNGKLSPATKKQIEQELFHQKFEADSKIWLDKIRSLAYIDIKQNG